MKFFGKIINGKIELDNPEQWSGYVTTMSEGNIELDIKKSDNIRTSRQNAAMHLWFTQLSEALNKDGFDMKKVISDAVDIYWTPYTVKEYLWKTVQKTLYGKKSTTQLKSNEIDAIYDIINKTVGERTGIFIPFPSIDNLRDYK